MAVRTYLPDWRHGKRKANSGYRGPNGQNDRRVALTGIQYQTYQSLHVLATRLSKSCGKHVYLHEALHYAVTNALRDLDQNKREQN